MMQGCPLGCCGTLSLSFPHGTIGCPEMFWKPAWVCLPSFVQVDNLEVGVGEEVTRNGQWVLRSVTRCFKLLPVGACRAWLLSSLDVR